MFYEYKKITKMEYKKLTEQIAQRTILYQALERKRHEELSESHHSIIKNRQTIESLGNNLKNTEQQLIAATEQNKSDIKTIQTLKLELQTLSITTSEQTTRLSELQSDNLELSHKNAEQQRQIEMLRGSSYNDYQDEQIITLQSKIKQLQFDERIIQEKLKNASEIITNLTKERDSLADSHNLLVTAAQAAIQCRQCGYRHEHNSTLTTNINISSHNKGGTYNGTHNNHNHSNSLRFSQDGSVLADLNTETGSFRTLQDSRQQTPFQTLSTNGKYTHENDGGKVIEGSEDDNNDNNDSVSFLGVPSPNKRPPEPTHKQQPPQLQKQQQRQQQQSYDLNGHYHQSEQSERDSRISEDNQRHAEQLLQEYQNQIVLLQQQHEDTVNDMQSQMNNLHATLDAKVEELDTLIETCKPLYLFCEVVVW